MLIDELRNLLYLTPCRHQPHGIIPLKATQQAKKEAANPRSLL